MVKINKRFKSDATFEDYLEESKKINLDEKFQPGNDLYLRDLFEKLSSNANPNCKELMEVLFLNLEDMILNEKGKSITEKLNKLNVFYTFYLLSDNNPRMPKQIRERFKAQSKAIEILENYFTTSGLECITKDDIEKEFKLEKKTRKIKKPKTKPKNTSDEEKPAVVDFNKKLENVQAQTEAWKLPQEKKSLKQKLQYLVKRLSKGSRRYIRSSSKRRSSKPQRARRCPCQKCNRKTSRRQ